MTEDDVTSATLDDLPGIIGELARLKALAELRLCSPARAQPETADVLLTADEAAARLKVPRSHLYRMKDCPFRVRVSAGRVRFSEKKLSAFIERRAK